jgi:hypothetical protein
MEGLKSPTTSLKDTKTPYIIFELEGLKSPIASFKDTKTPSSLNWKV